MDDMISISTHHLDTLRRCGGFYNCPRDDQGRRLGPLVAYTGTYQTALYQSAQRVGDVYANFAMVEKNPSVLRNFASSMQEKLEPLKSAIDVFCGVPGGHVFSQELALIFERKAIGAEKDERSRLFFRHHSVEEGKRYVIVKDVCSDLFRTEELISLVISAGGIVTAIVCLLNRSMYFEDSFPSESAGEMPIISLVRKPIMEYRQDNPEVIDDIQTGNVVWDPIGSWPQLLQIMQDNSR